MSADGEPVENGPRVERESPYFGLDYYDEKYGEWLFGRETERDRLITNLRAARLTLLHAESGVGKSSLLRAGVAWQLDQLAREGVQQRGRPRYVPVVFSSWKDDPTSGLIDEIGDAIKRPFHDRTDYVAAHPTLDVGAKLPRGSLEEAIVAAADAVGGNLLIILDQFEEYFRYSSGERPAEHFADELARCINRAELPASFLISIREDAYAGLGDLFQGRIANVYGNYLDIEYLDRDAAGDAIRKPLDVYNKQPGVEPVQIEKGLVQAVLSAAQRDDPDTPSGTNARTNGDGLIETPLLQLVMQTVWEQERADHSSVLRLSTLEDKLHGAESILDEHLAKALATLSNEQERQTAIDVLDQLVTDSGPKIARSIPALAERTRHSEQQVTNVLAKLDKQYIVRSVEAPPGKDHVRFRRYEIFHDVLAPAINRAVQNRTADCLRHERNAAMQRVAIIGGLAVLAAIALVFATLWAIQAKDARNSARREARLNLSAALAVESGDLLTSKPVVSSLLALKAYALVPSSDSARAALTDALEQPLNSILRDGHRINSVAVSPDGQLLASGDTAGNITLWNLQTKRPLGHVRDRYAVTSVAFAAHGDLLASGDEKGHVILWNMTQPRHITGRQMPLSDHATFIFSVAFSPDGGLLASGDNQGQINLWRVRTAATDGQPLDDGSNAYGLTFSQNGKTLASGDEKGRVALWNLATHESISLPHDSSTVFSVAFDPARHELAAGDDSGNVVLWNLATHRQIGRMTPSLGSAVRSVAFSPSGDELASGDYAGKVVLWDPATQTRVSEPMPDESTVFSVVFLPGHQGLASADQAGDIVLWNLSRQAQVGKSLRVGPPVWSVAFSPLGDELASGDASGDVVLWNLAQGSHRVLFHSAGSVLGVTFSVDGKWLAAGDQAGGLTLWDLTTGHAQRLEHEHSEVSSIAFSADDKLLASGDDLGYVELWDVGSGKRVGRRRTPMEGAVRSLAFSPHGGLLAIGTTGGEDNVILWKLHKGSERSPDAVTLFDRRELPDRSPVSGIAFSPNGEELASGDDEGNVLLWDVAQDKPIGAPLIGGEGKIQSVAFSHDGSTLISAGFGGNITLSDPSTGSRIGQIPGDGSSVYDLAYDPRSGEFAAVGQAGTIDLLSTSYADLLRAPRSRRSLGELGAELCTRVRQNLEPSEWREYVPGAPYEQLCSGF
jgi:WD40 repeat protein